MNFTIEKHYKIFVDDTGEVLLIGPDRDGLGMVEFRYQTDEGRDYASFTLPKEALSQLEVALKGLRDDAESF